MDTIRLTYSPYGFGRLLKVIQADVPAEEKDSDGGAGRNPDTTKKTYYVTGQAQEDENA